MHVLGEEKGTVVTPKAVVCLAGTLARPIAIAALVAVGSAGWRLAGRNLAQATAHMYQKDPHGVARRLSLGIARGAVGTSGPEWGPAAAC